VAMDVVQMAIYMGGAATSMFVIINQLPAGWSDVGRFATAGASKFEVLNRNWGSNLAEFLTTPYTLLGGFLGGTVLTMASHGTDQLLVQRLLGCKSCRDSQKALLLDAAVIVFQFAFFLVLGLCLFAFYGGVPFEQLGLKSSDEIFPYFIVHNLPRGAVGLVIAGVLASAMGTLSSSISSLASSSYLDLFRVTRMADGLTARGELFWSKLFCLLWGIVLIGGAMMFRDSRNPVVEIGLKIASFSYGGLLGTFLLGLFFRRTRENDARIGLLAGLTAMGLILWLTRIDFTWHTLIGCVVTVMVGNAMALLGRKRSQSTLV
jgi:solute:Na+ symporter, SSS family